MMKNVRLNGSAMFSAALDSHQGQMILGLSLWCSGLKGYTLQGGGVQPHGLGSNPAQAKN